MYLLKPTRLVGLLLAPPPLVSFVLAAFTVTFSLALKATMLSAYQVLGNCENLPVPFEIVDETTLHLMECKYVFTIFVAKDFVFAEIDTLESATFGSFVADFHDKSRESLTLFNPCTLKMK